MSNNGSNVVNAIQHLKMAIEHFEDFNRQFPNSSGSRLFNTYISKIKLYIFKDLLTYPHFTEDVREAIRAEIASDAFSIPAITEKVALLRPDQREIIEMTIDAMLSGQEILIGDKPPSE